MNEQAIKTKWRAHVGNSGKKHVLPLSLADYRQKILDAGILPEQIGQTRTSYHLARYSDTGDYTPHSCRFIPHLDNLAEQRLNGGLARMAEKKRGRTKLNDPSVASQAKKMLGRTKETHSGVATASEKTAIKLRGRTKENDPGRASAALKTAKPFAFIDPSGVVHRGRNVDLFCKVHGLLGNAMSKLKNGHLKSYHGWKIVENEV